MHTLITSWIRQKLYQLHNSRWRSYNFKIDNISGNKQHQNKTHTKLKNERERGETSNSQLCAVYTTHNSRKQLIVFVSFCFHHIWATFSHSYTMYISFFLFARFLIFFLSWKNSNSIARALVPHFKTNFSLAHTNIALLSTI